MFAVVGSNDLRLSSIRARHYRSSKIQVEVSVLKGEDVGYHPFWKMQP